MLVHVSSTMWRIKNQPSNSTSSGDNAVRLLVLVAGILYWGLQVMSSLSIRGCVLKGCFERGIFWRAKVTFGRVSKTSNLNIAKISRSMCEHVYVQGEPTVGCRWTSWVREITGWSSRALRNVPIVLEESIEYTSNEWIAKPEDVNMQPVEFRITRTLADYAQKLPGHWTILWA